MRTLEKVHVAANNAGQKAVCRAPAGSPGKLVPSKSKLPLPWVEVALFDPATRLAGVPDRVERRNGVLRLVDLKSGVKAQEVSQSQRAQLLLYAHLVKVALGELPDEAVIVNVKGEEQLIAFTASEVDSLVKGAVGSISDFNLGAEESSTKALPSEQACRRCPFRVVCEEYWDTRGDLWPTLDVRGAVVEVHTSGFVVRHWKDEGRLTRIVGSHGTKVALHSEVAITDLARAGDGAGRLQWWSRVRLSA